MRDYYYTEELELALGYDNVDLQHLIYDICSKDKEKFLPFEDWVCEKRNEFKEIGERYASLKAGIFSKQSPVA